MKNYERDGSCNKARNFKIWSTVFREGREQNSETKFLNFIYEDGEIGIPANIWKSEIRTLSSLILKT